MWKSLLVLIGSVHFFGCALSSDLVPVYQDIHVLRKKFSDFEKKQKDFLLVSVFDSSVADSKQRLADTNNALEQIRREIRQLRGDIDTVRRGVVIGHLPGTDFTKGSVTKSIAELETSLEILKLIQKELVRTIDELGAFLRKKFSKKRIRKASPMTAEMIRQKFKDSAFGSVVRQAPVVLEKIEKQEERLSLQYLYAEALFKVGRLAEAALKFQEIIDVGSSDYFTKSKLRMGDALYYLGEKEVACHYFREVVSEFPESQEAEKAQTYLSKPICQKAD